ncbi:DUF2177 family protein [Halanaerobium saccharolyticum]|jgi:uncharacterized membrane protein|uniref:Putative membrane protein n=1 Tax=Halanaerobium saccharolyticum TaxID=43595 RepID=A0A2T5RRA4_9FIRM|nr:MULTISPECIES: DUF2177 family protein [Halanaerobium]OEG61820.1 MAG: hypothetical protein BHK79_01545 [Halanaerobium sp. MDAL1]PTW02683.1 putative membrane protein [Halanaerobium saccharolyticum]PUU89611.1 MAG: hypothetical protein CI947_1649 [Halanaerobium sp.]PUU95178.1 MAG: hypothetical protein CI949_295 [Halanaerobium sp.]TDP91237.1 putative membrane protein [Halanaerobium saccharolyticum]
MVFLKNYLITFIIFLVIDFIWLGAVARNLYRNQLGFLMKENFNMTAAFIFYLLFTAGLVFFVLNQALAISSWQYALFAGMFFGLITYSTYDLTNLATIKDWPLTITIIDLIWGTFLGGITSYLSYIVINYFR